ncbi:MAG: hypothetical protein ACKKMS_00005 [Candidatus Nealsonbacteria bacterium]
MTQQEEKEIERVCGPNYKYNDIPAFIRKRELAEARAEDALVEEGIQREKEKIAEEEEERRRSEEVMI